MSKEGEYLISTSFNSTHSGRNITVSASKYLNKKHEIGWGVHFNLNRLAHPDDQFNVYKKRLYATKPVEYLGIDAYYHHHIFEKLTIVKPFLFYDLQISYSGTRNVYFIPYTYDSNGQVLYIRKTSYFGPFTWVEVSPLPTPSFMPPAELLALPHEENQ